MKILFVASPNLGAQDMLIDSLLYGLVRLYGETNVNDFFHLGHYRGEGEFTGDWPIHLGALAYKCPVPIHNGADPPYRYDRIFLNASLVERYPEFVTSNTILMNGSDVSSSPPNLIGYWGQRNIAGVIHRPGCRWNDMKSMQVHITVPDEHLSLHLARADRQSVVDAPEVIASWSDNNEQRYDVMRCLSGAFSKDARVRLRFGSAAGRQVTGAFGTCRLPQYLREMESAKVVVSCKGANPDCLRIWEAFAMGKCLITHDFGFSDDFQDGVHCIYYQTPEECVQKVRWTLKNPDEAKWIAENGSLVYRVKHTPEAQTLRIMEALNG